MEKIPMMGARQFRTKPKATRRRRFLVFVLLLISVRRWSHSLRRDC
jgi:hypothetical protein